MAHFTVVQAVENRVAANFTRCPVYVENGLGETPSDGSPYLQIQFPYANTEWAEVEGVDGSGFTEEGAVRFILAVSRGGGAHEGRQWMAELASLFRGVVVDGVQFFSPDSPVGDDRNEVAGYYRLSIACPYEFHFAG